MALVLKNRVKVTSTTTGTGTFTLGSAVAGYQSFDAISPTSAAWDVSKAFYNGQSFSVAAQETNPQDLFFKPDGTKMYVIGSTGDDINEYDLSIAWDITTATYLQNFSVAGQELTPSGLFFKPDGTKLYISGTTGDDVNEYDLSTAWDVSSASYVQNFSVVSQDTTPLGLFFKPDGTKMYVLGGTGDDVNQYDLGTPWNISTASFVQNFSVASQETTPSGISFKPDGTRMYVVGSGNDFVNEYSLSSAWDISTASFVQNFFIDGQEPTSTGLFFKEDGTQFFIVGQSRDRIFSYYIGSVETYYFITDGTDFEAGAGSVLAGTVLVRDRVFASSNSNALVNWGAGNKDVVCGYPAEGTPGGIPFCDDSEIGTDLSGWQAFRTALESGITGGQTYANNGVNGIVSTYSLIYTSPSAFANIYRGAVLALNGDVHFVPHSAVVGQKISELGVVSTYSLIYTGSAVYGGGVLAPNGDIHFIPQTAAVGQKISAAGVVSTYSLVYTAINAYGGGVLSPNGDIHFVPLGAAVGQKVSAAGVVSTYSLINTGGVEYWGGVLAPNGDIHFVPYNAAVGQKISASGVVSTYTLVYSGGSRFGGVLAPNGDIHFVPASAAVGQKISAAGVVSTYSLVYTTSGAYNGGVLAPNGEIHFIPQDATVGQKISVDGTVSTYTLSYTATSAPYSGGVLDKNNNIHFSPLNAPVGQKISIQPGKAFGPGICLSPFLNKL